MNDNKPTRPVTSVPVKTTNYTTYVSPVPGSPEDLALQERARAQAQKRREAEETLLATILPHSELPDAAGAVFYAHLAALLPLRNPNGPAHENAVCDYIKERLPMIGRLPVCDLMGNITGLALAPAPDMYAGEKRGVVGHTDSVSQKWGADREEVSFVGGVFRSQRSVRPMGGDDKVGVAIALTVAEFVPWVTAIFPANEESGCTGSDKLKIERHDLLLQCDRKGASDLVGEISWVEIASQHAQYLASALLPHRSLVQGGLTDVMTLVENAMTHNAFNLSCGYYDPHTSAECVVFAHALQTLRDVWTLLHGLPPGLSCAKGFDTNNWRKYSRKYAGNMAGYGYSGGWRDDDEGDLPAYPAVLAQTIDEETVEEVEGTSASGQLANDNEYLAEICGPIYADLFQFYCAEYDTHNLNDTQRDALEFDLWQEYLKDYCTMDSFQKFLRGHPADYHNGKPMDLPGMGETTGSLFSTGDDPGAEDALARMYDL